MSARSFDLAVMAGAAAEYAANRFWLRWVLPDPLRYFLICWGNDIFAGAFLLAWLNLLLSLGGLRPLIRLRYTVPLLLVCGLAWEVLAPLWKSAAVFDPWDFLAYQAGGLLYLALRRALDILTGSPGGQRTGN